MHQELSLKRISRAFTIPDRRNLTERSIKLRMSRFGLNGRSQPLQSLKVLNMPSHDVLQVQNETLQENIRRRTNISLR